VKKCVKEIGTHTGRVKQQAKKNRTTIALTAASLVIVAAAVIFTFAVLPGIKRAELEDISKAVTAYKGILKVAYDTFDEKWLANNFQSFAIVDINGDNMPELIHNNGYCGAESELNFYSYIANKVVFIGEIEGGHFELSDENCNDGRLIIHYGVTGYESASQIKIEDYKLFTTEIMAWHKINDEYTEYSNLIEMHPLGDYESFVYK